MDKINALLEKIARSRLIEEKRYEVSKFLLNNLSSKELIDEAQNYIDNYKEMDIELGKLVDLVSEWGETREDNIGVLHVNGSEIFIYDRGNSLAFRISVERKEITL